MLVALRGGATRRRCTIEPLATSLDVMERLGRVFNPAEAMRVEPLLRDASAAVRLRSGQEFTAGTSTIALPRNPQGRIVLPQFPVTSIDNVKDVYGYDVGYYWQVGMDRIETQGRLLNEFEIEPLRVPTSTVVVTYSHGYPEVPDEIVAVVCGIVGRALGTPPDQGGTTQEGIDGYNYSIGTAAAAGGLGILANELAIIDAYKRPVPATPLLT